MCNFHFHNLLFQCISWVCKQQNFVKEINYFFSEKDLFDLSSETVVPRCSVKNMFLKISQNSLENTCVWVFFLIKLQASGKNTYLLYRAPPVTVFLFCFNY